VGLLAYIGLSLSSALYFGKPSRSGRLYRGKPSGVDGLYQGSPARMVLVCFIESQVE
jgi:hypothetical protein